MEGLPVLLLLEETKEDDELLAVKTDGTKAAMLSEAAGRRSGM